MYTLTSVNTHLAAGMHKHTLPSRNVFEKTYVLIPSQLRACAPRRTRLPKAAQRTSFCALLTAVSGHSYVDLRLNSFSLRLILEDFVTDVLFAVQLTHLSQKPWHSFCVFFLFFAEVVCV